LAAVPTAAQVVASCDNSTDCMSTVEVSSDRRGGCTYRWPTKNYVVAAKTKPKLLWTLGDTTFEWDPTKGIRLQGHMNFPLEDLTGGSTVPGKDETYRWIAVQTPTQEHVLEGDKTYTIEMFISKDGNPCSKILHEPDYTIVLKR
jgi:hypothetical protein